MKKINKIKKGIVKYFNAEIECKCVDANTFKMSVNDKNIFVCEVCHGENNPYLGIVESTNQFTEEAEKSLKEAITESKNLFSVK